MRVESFVNPLHVVSFTRKSVLLISNISLINYVLLLG